MAKTKKAPAKKTTTKASAKKTTVKKSTKKTTAKTTAKKTKTTKATKAKKTDKTENLELLNETGRRKKSVKPVVERRKRRRQIDPTTCERDYNDAEIEFMHAMDDYKQQSGRMFPTCSEILEVIQKLGYRQIAEAATVMYDPNEDKKVVEEESLDTEFDDEDDE